MLPNIVRQPATQAQVQQARDHFRDLGFPDFNQRASRWVTGELVKARERQFASLSAVPNPVTGISEQSRFGGDSDPLATAAAIAAGAAAIVPAATSSIVPTAPAALPGGNNGMTTIRRPNAPSRVGPVNKSIFGDIIGGVVGAIPGVGGILGPLAGGIFGSGQTPSSANPPTPGVGFTGPSSRPRCFPPFFLNPRTGQCELDLVPGPGGGGTGPIRDQPNGHGRIPPSTLQGGAPMVEQIVRRECGKGSVLGDNGLCYDKRTIPNSRRMWPKPTRPLGSTGEMNAVTRATQFGRRLKSKEKALKKLGRQLGGVGR